MITPEAGDYVRYKLPCGIEGLCLLTEEGHSKTDGRPMFYGRTEDRRVPADISLHIENIVDVLACGDAWCWGCGHGWIALRPVGVEVLECPQCGEMMGVIENS